MNFKLLALRPLEGCSENVLKNLSTDHFYFFDNNYRVDVNSGVTQSNDATLLPSNFFYSKKNEITSLEYINVQALVGKNGEGKSSLIELLLRVLNNFYKQYEIGTVTDNLLFAEGVVAEVYFEVNSEILKIYVDSRKVTKFGDRPQIIANACIDRRMIYDSSDYNKENPRRKQEEVELDHLFFSMYINYSLYGLDDSEYYLENQYANEHGFPYDEISKINRFIPDSWLTKIFHKNDGYQTPIVIHPFRIQGQIDIKNEKYLISQRLLSLIIEESPKKYNITEDLVADKIYLQFKETDHLDIYLKDFIKNTKEVNDFAKAMQVFEISKLNNEQKIAKIKDLDKFLTKNHVLLNKFKSSIFKQDSKPVFTDVFWILVEYITAFADEKDKEEIGSLLKDEDLRLYLERIKQFFSEENYKIVYSVLTKTAGFNYQIYNFYQLLTIHYNFWSEELKIDQNRLEKGYVEYKFESNLFYYLVMKSFRTIYYPKYQSFSRTNTIEHFAAHLKSDETTTINPHKEFLKLIYTKDKSHISLKLRQTIHILELAVSEPENKLIKFYKSLIGANNVLSFGELNNYLPKENSEDKLLMLPPRVFDTDIYLKSERTNQNNISIKKVSSGEYQKVAILSSVIYHLKNLDSVESQKETATESVRAFKLKPIYSFKNINLILDEIELYFHPEFQRLFIKELLERLSKMTFKNIKSINILFITHSPFILSDIPKRNVLFLEDGKPIKAMSENTFASNVHTLLQHGFFLNAVPIGEFAKEKINIMFEFLHNGKTIDNQGNDLYDQIILVGEPFVKSQLLKLYNDLKIVDIGFEDKINLLLAEIDKLKKEKND